MKKLFTIMTAIAMVVAFGVTAYAANTVQVTLTSPAIIKQGCEKVGAVTYAIDSNTVLNPGDWWYFDLPNGAFVCKKIDYFMGSFPVAGEALDFVTPQGSLNDDVLLATLGGAALGIPTIPVNSEVGPFANVAGGAGADIVPTGNILFRVKADVNSRRVWLYVYGVDPADNILVPNDTVFKVKILDGKAYQNNIVTNGVGGSALNWGDAEGETIGLGAAINFTAPYPENTLCVNAEQMVGDLMFVSFDSKFDFLTFTGDSQIAHVIDENPISIQFCSKLDITGNIPLADQNACAFDYESPTGYCPDFTGNYLHVVAQQPFGVSTDKWDMVVTVDTPGVYFGGAPVVTCYTPAQNACDMPGLGAALPMNSGWIAANEGGTIVAAYPGSSCAVSVNSRVRRVYTEGGDIDALNIYDTLQFNFANFVYDLSIVGAGTEVDLTVSMSKWPCGSVFSASTTIGTFVVNCGLATGSTALLFPWFPPMDFASSNWWGGFSIINAGTDTGELILTFWEVDGDRGTYNAGTLAPGEQYNPGYLPDLLPMITPNPANTGTLGDANFAMTAACAFGSAGGFAFTGNTIEGTGYTANVLGSDGWQ